MRQQLYPSGQALYCANDGIPIHHFQPTTRRGLKVPPPGLSRPLIDLIKRLGIQVPINKSELRAAQAQIEDWKRLANQTHAQPNLPSLAPPQSISSSESVPLLPPEGLSQHLQTLSQSLKSANKPILVFKRPGPENTDTLYSSIKADEIIASLVNQLDFQPPRPLEAPISNFLKIVGFSDSPEELPPGPDHHLNYRFKPIKTTGNYLLTLSLSSSHHQHASKESDEQIYTFSVLIEKGN